MLLAWMAVRHFKRCRRPTLLASSGLVCRLALCTAFDIATQQCTVVIACHKALASRLFRPLTLACHPSAAGNNSMSRNGAGCMSGGGMCLVMTRSERRSSTGITVDVVSAVDGIAYVSNRHASRNNGGTYRLNLWSAYHKAPLLAGAGPWPKQVSLNFTVEADGTLQWTEYAAARLKQLPFGGPVFQLRRCAATAEDTAAQARHQLAANQQQHDERQPAKRRRQSSPATRQVDETAPQPSGAAQQSGLRGSSGSGMASGAGSSAAELPHATAPWPAAQLAGVSGSANGSTTGVASDAAAVPPAVPAELPRGAAQPSMPGLGASSTAVAPAGVASHATAVPPAVPADLLSRAAQQLSMPELGASSAAVAPAGIAAELHAAHGDAEPWYWQRGLPLVPGRPAGRLFLLDLWTARITRRRLPVPVRFPRRWVDNGRHQRRRLQ